MRTDARAIVSATTLWSNGGGVTASRAHRHGTTACGSGRRLRRTREQSPPSGSPSTTTSKSAANPIPSSPAELRTVRRQSMCEHFVRATTTQRQFFGQRSTVRSSLSSSSEAVAKDCSVIDIPPNQNGTRLRNRYRAAEGSHGPRSLPGRSNSLAWNTSGSIPGGRAAGGASRSVPLLPRCIRSRIRIRSDLNSAISPTNQRAGSPNERGCSGLSRRGSMFALSMHGV